VRFIYQYPDTHGLEADLLDSGRVHVLAAAAEAAGWHGFAFTEHPVPSARWLGGGGHQTLDPFVALGHVAAVTTRLRLLTYLAVVPYRNPFLLAKAAATVDKLSDGRFVLGVGTGYLKSEFFALGVDFDERNALFDEALEVLPLHWAGEPFTHAGAHFDARDSIGRPRPVQNPIPIWIGGNARVTLRRVAERAQGWMPLTGPPEMATTVRTAYLSTLQDLKAKVGELRDLSGDRADQIDVAIAYTPTWSAAPAHDADRHREAVADLEDVGATWIVVPGPIGPEAASLEFIEAFAKACI
jgi:probable F420-dependent oxidoreductase